MATPLPSGADKPKPESHKVDRFCFAAPPVFKKLQTATLLPTAQSAMQLQPAVPSVNVRGKFYFLLSASAFWTNIVFVQRTLRITENFMTSGENIPKDAKAQADQMAALLSAATNCYW